MKTLIFIKLVKGVMIVIVLIGVVIISMITLIFLIMIIRILIFLLVEVPLGSLAKFYHTFEGSFKVLYASFISLKR